MNENLAFGLIAVTLGFNIAMLYIIDDLSKRRSKRLEVRIDRLEGAATKTETK